MNTTADETTIEVLDDLPAIRITREFDAPAAAVFRAHVEPDLVVRWLGPRDLEMEVDTWDCRTGGAYRYVHVRGDERYGFHGSFHDVLPESGTIVQTFTFDGMPDAVALERMTITDLGDGRCRLVGFSLGDSFEARDAMVASGMEHGIREGYERLDEVVAGMPAR